MAFQTSCGPSRRSSVFALRTTVTAPPTATSTPQKSRSRKASWRRSGAMIQLEIKATTPNGETIEAGAKPYARKLPVSPMVINVMPNHQYGERRYEFGGSLTGACSPLELDENECVRGSLAL